VRFEEAIAARRSVRAFEDRPVPRAAVDRAISLAVQAPAPHHSSPWRFALVDKPQEKDGLSRAMGAAWRADLTRDGLPGEKIEAILDKSHGLLTSTPLLTICFADMTKAHPYVDERRERAEWSLFAHSMGAALQTYMTSLAADGIASCWISAPVFCGETLKSYFSLPPEVEPHALVLVGYASPDYTPRPRPTPDPTEYLIRN
jgi:coenzyme F420-0:L-glutamate ligase / coenzyme F420-1:gamma-L-glutamate ligase